MTVLDNFVVYHDGNCFITKFTPSNGQKILIRCIGEVKGPYGTNKVVAGFTDKVGVAMPKLKELAGLKAGRLYCLRATGVKTKGKYTIFGFEVAEISSEQYTKMLDIVDYVNIIDGFYSKYSNFPRNIINMEEDPLPSSSSSSSVSASEYMSFKELYQVFKKLGSSVKYYSEDHFVLVHQYKHRINETKAGYRRDDVQAVVNKIVGE